MKRRKFVKQSSAFLLYPLLDINNVFSRMIEEPPRIQMPGLNNLIKDQSYKIHNNSDLEKHFHDSIQKFKKYVPTEKPKIERVIDNFSAVRDQDKNGLEGISQIYQMKEYMNEHEMQASTPAFRTKSSYSKFNISSQLCDASTIQITKYQDLVVFPLDNRVNNRVYLTPKSLSYLLFNPKYYCIGLPSQQPQKVYLSYEFKKQIFEETSIEPQIDSYNYQEFTFMGSSICRNGLESGPQKRKIFYNHDDSIRKFFNLVPVDECGDTNEYKCNLMV